MPRLFGCELAAVRELLEPSERDAELVEALADALVGARPLRRRADAFAREPIRQRRMVVEVADQRRQDVRVAHEWRGLRSHAAERELAASSGIGEVSVEARADRREPGGSSGLPYTVSLREECGRGRGRGHVDLDDTGIRRDA